jgi:DNA-binding NarL/FixJ family response regulator
LREIFIQRVERSGVTLSLRERDVCLALLMGHTVAEIASKLSVRSSTVETYTKRAAVKLGVSGRHGLTRWVAGVPTC